MRGRHIQRRESNDVHKLRDRHVLKHDGWDSVHDVRSWQLRVDDRLVGVHCLSGRDLPD